MKKKWIFTTKMVIYFFKLDILIDYERNSGINCLKLENANESLRAIFDKRYNTAGKSFGVSNKKSQLKRYTDNKMIKTDQKSNLNLLSDAKDKETYNVNYSCFYGVTPKKSDSKGDGPKKFLMFQSDDK